jgi:hypothetical protein
VEEWLAQGSLSQVEFELMVRLVGRYVRWDVDQFDHWVMPTDAGPWYVDFSIAPSDGATGVRPVWPTAEPGGPAWVVWRQDDNGVRAEVARFASSAPAHAVARYFEQLGHKQIYWVQDPPE